MDAYDFSENNRSRFNFGLDRAKMASVLRDLADKVETGVICPQSARVMTMAPNDDFTTTVLRLVFAEERALVGEGKRKMLYGPEPFPNDVVRTNS